MSIILLRRPILNEDKEKGLFNYHEGIYDSTKTALEQVLDLTRAEKKYGLVANTQKRKCKFRLLSYGAFAEGQEVTTLPAEDHEEDIIRGRLNNFVKLVRIIGVVNEKNKEITELVVPHIPYDLGGTGDGMSCETLASYIFTGKVMPVQGAIYSSIRNFLVKKGVSKVFLDWVVDSLFASKD